MSDIMGGSAFAPDEGKRRDDSKRNNGDGVHGVAPGESGTTTEKDLALRDRLGRFKPGHHGGPGNPYGRAVALLRRAMLDFMTPERMVDLCEMMYGEAMMGGRGWAELLLKYTVGKPAAVADPDRVELDEWRMPENPHAAEIEEQQGARFPAVVMNVLHRALDGVKGVELLKQLDRTQAAHKKEKEQQAARAERRRQKKEERQRRKRLE